MTGRSRKRNRRKTPRQKKEGPNTRRRCTRRRKRSSGVKTPRISTASPSLPILLKSYSFGLAGKRDRREALRTDKSNFRMSRRLVRKQVQNWNRRGESTILRSCNFFSERHTNEIFSFALRRLIVLSPPAPLAYYHLVRRDLSPGRKPRGRKLMKMFPAARKRGASGISSLRERTRPLAVSRRF